MKIRYLSLLCNFLFVGCYVNGLYVQEEWVNRDFLASSQVETPDPRQKCPPKGQRLLVGWDLPRSLYRQHPKLSITVWLWDNTLEKIECDLQRRRGSEAFFFPNEEPDLDRRILTYKVDIVSADGTILKTWKHHFWTKLIKLDS